MENPSILYSHFLLLGVTVGLESIPAADWSPVWWRNIYLNSLPAPLSVFGVVGEPPHVHVRLDDLRSEDEIFLVLAGGDGLNAAVEAKRLWTQLQSYREQNIQEMKKHVATSVKLCVCSGCCYYNVKKLRNGW